MGLGVNGQLTTNVPKCTAQPLTLSPRSERPPKYTAHDVNALGPCSASERPTLCSTRAIAKMIHTAKCTARNDGTFGPLLIDPYTLVPRMNGHPNVHGSCALGQCSRTGLCARCPLRVLGYHSERPTRAWSLQGARLALIKGSKVNGLLRVHGFLCARPSSSSLSPRARLPRCSAVAQLTRSLCAASLA